MERADLAQQQPAPYKFHLSTDQSEKSYSLDEEELRFFKTATGIEDADDLQTHIIGVQREAYKIHPYPCIASFTFTKLRLARLEAYARLLEMGIIRKNPIFLDVGCCFGNDVRKAILDGYPQASVIATDIVPEFWSLGHKLFNTTPESFPIPFIPGDAFNPDFLAPTQPFPAAPPGPAPALSDLTSLTPLLGRVFAISVCAVFHLFDTEESQYRLARALGGLLSPEPGSMIIGTHKSGSKKGRVVEHVFGKDYSLFYHSPDSWRELWDGGIFPRGEVEVDARLVQHVYEGVMDGAVVRRAFWYLEWSVTRVS